jgi:hypothetical protein
MFDVTYRGTSIGGKQAEVRLKSTYAAATLADAWGRLSELFEDVDPRSIEIEIRECRCPVRLISRGELVDYVTIDL